MGNNANPPLRELYPQLNEKELSEAEENFDRYLTLVRSSTTHGFTHRRSLLARARAGK